MSDQVEKKQEAPSEDKPIWTLLPEKRNVLNQKLCVLPGCERSMVAKRVCQNHYQAIRLNTLDPVTGMTKSERKLVSKEEKLAGEPQGLPKSFEGFDAYVYLMNGSHILRKDNGNRIHINDAVNAWGSWIRDAIRAGKFKCYDEECWIPVPGYDTGRLYNSYKPLETLKPTNVGEPLNPNLELLLKNLFDGPDMGFSYDWALDWFSYKLSHPHECTGALVVSGVQKAGKGTLESVMQAIFKDQCSSIDSVALDQDFNNWADRKFMIIADEISSVTDRDRDRVRKQLKKYTAPNSLLINKKNVGSYNVRNYASWLIFSNDKRTVQIEEGDRRYSVFSPATTIKDELGREISNNATFYGQNLVNALYDRELEYFTPGVPLMNKARDAMAKLNNVTVIGRK